MSQSPTKPRGITIWFTFTMSVRSQSILAPSTAPAPVRLRPMTKRTKISRACSACQEKRIKVGSAYIPKFWKEAYWNSAKAEDSVLVEYPAGSATRIVPNALSTSTLTNAGGLYSSKKLMHLKIRLPVSWRLYETRRRLNGLLHL
jgi:hypothetical protein